MTLFLDGDVAERTSLTLAEVRDAIVTCARLWKTDPFWAVPRLPVTAPAFEAGLEAAIPELWDVLDDAIGQFLGEVYRHLCSRNTRLPAREPGGADRYETTTFVMPVIGPSATIARLISEDLEALNDLLWNCPVLRTEDQATFLPACATPARLAQMPVALPVTLHALFLKAQGMAGPITLPSMADLREAAALLETPDFGPADGVAVRGLVGLRVQRQESMFDGFDDPFHDAVKTRGLIARLQARWPDLAFDAPSDPITAVRRMAACEICRDLADLTRLHGLPEDARPDEIWLHHHPTPEGEVLEIVAHHGRLELGPITVPPRIAMLATREISVIVEETGGEIVINEEAYSRAGATAH